MHTPSHDSLVAANTNPLTKLDLPHNITIEQALLSALMNVEEGYERISGLIGADDFYGERHQHIFRCIEHLAKVGQPYDSLTVYDALAKQELLGVIGGEEYLIQIEQSTGTAFNLENYAERIQELSAYRRLIQAGNQILEMAYRPKTQSLGDILDKAESQIFAINESLQKRDGKQGVKPAPVAVQEVIDYFQMIKKRGAGALIGLDTSFEELNNKIQGLQKGHLLILAARPGVGKTTLALNLAQSVLQQNLPVVMFSMEMKSSEIIMRLLSAWGSIDHGRIQSGDVRPEEWGIINNGITHILHSKLYIDDRNDLAPTEIRSVCRKIAKQHPETGIGLVVVDYLQLMKVPGKENNRVLEVAEISRSLKALAREMDCPVLALSQMSRDAEKRPNSRPRASDLRDSGAIEQDADLIMFIYREDMRNDKENKAPTNIAEIIIEKNRHGARGTIPLRFEGQFSRFSNIVHYAHEVYDDMPPE